VFIETCNLYAESVGKIYVSNFKTYSSELFKLLVSRHGKDLVVSDLMNKEHMFGLENRDVILGHL
jgi:hypothetical protein